MDKIFYFTLILGLGAFITVPVYAQNNQDMVLESGSALSGQSESFIPDRTRSASKSLLRYGGQREWGIPSEDMNKAQMFAQADLDDEDFEEEEEEIFSDPIEGLNRVFFILNDTSPEDGRGSNLNELSLPSPGAFITISTIQQYYHPSIKRQIWAVKNVTMKPIATGMRDAITVHFALPFSL